MCKVGKGGTSFDQPNMQETIRPTTMSNPFETEDEQRGKDVQMRERERENDCCNVTVIDDGKEHGNGNNIIL